MPLFAQQLCVDDSVAPPLVPGLFDDARGLRLTESGDPVAATMALPTRADRDKDDTCLATVTKAMQDSDDQSSLDAVLLLATRTAAGIDQDDDRLLFEPTIFSCPDKDN